MYEDIKIPKSYRRDSIDIDLNELYARANAELALQQNKRDQIITIYLAMFSFLIPFALSMDILSWQVKGLIFLAVAIVGILFALVIIRYRIYKEAYWFCCQAITVLFGIKAENYNKQTVQQVYKECIMKKSKKFFIKNEKKHKLNGKRVLYAINDIDGFHKAKPEEMEGETYIFSKKAYVSGNIFSAESIHFFIHAFITSLMLGLSLALVVGSGLIVGIIVGAITVIASFLILSFLYFKECIKIYGVMVDGTTKSFNAAFSKAWFLHFYID